MNNLKQQGTDQVKPLTLSRFLYGAVITSALAFGAIGGLLVLFMADMFFDVGPDPAIRKTSEQTVDARFTALEERLKTQAAQHAGQNDTVIAQELNTLKEHYSAALEETIALKDALTQKYADSGMQERVAQTVLGLTQLKHANEEDTSLEPGIETLQQVFTEGVIYETLEELKQQESLPSRAEILSDLDAYRYDDNAQTEQDNTQEPPKTWKERAVSVMKTVISISPTAQIVNKDTLNTIRQAVVTGNFELAETLTDKLPESPRKKLLRTKLAARAKTERAINTIVSKTGTALKVGPKGSIY